MHATAVILVSMNSLFFAHAGHLHTETVTQAGFSLSYTAFMWLLLGASALTVFLLSHIILKQKIERTLFVMGLFLTVHGVLTSAHSGPYSAIGLIGGLASALVLVRIRFAAPQR